jgi:hypothetical protein
MSLNRQASRTKRCASLAWRCTFVACTFVVYYCYYYYYYIYIDIHVYICMYVYINATCMYVYINATCIQSVLSHDWRSVVFIVAGEHDYDPEADVDVENEMDVDANDSVEEGLLRFPSHFTRIRANTHTHTRTHAQNTSRTHTHTSTLLACTHACRLSIRA